MRAPVQTLVFDSKPYDREALQRASAGCEIQWRFSEFRLSAETAVVASGAQAVCIFKDLCGQILHDDELARLLTFPNVLITAHRAFLTHEALAEIARVTVANLLAAGNGQPFLPDTAPV